MSSLYYFCSIKNNRITGQIYGFDCIKYDNFEDANKHKLMYTYDTYGTYENQTTIIPICKYTPSVIHPHILNCKLFNLFWQNKINIRD